MINMIVERLWLQPTALSGFNENQKINLIKFT